MTIEELRLMNEKQRIIYFSMIKIKDLKEILKSEGIEVYSRLKKAELLKMVLDMVVVTKENEDNNIIEKVKNTMADEIEELNIEDCKQDADFIRENVWTFDDFIYLFTGTYKKCQQEEGRHKHYEKLYHDYMERQTYYMNLYEEYKNKYEQLKALQFTNVFQSICGTNNLIPTGQEDKFKKLLKDCSKIYHPDKPTGNNDMMIFVNELSENFKKINK